MDQEFQLLSFPKVLNHYPGSSFGIRELHLPQLETQEHPFGHATRMDHVHCLDVQASFWCPLSKFVKFSWSHPINFSTSTPPLPTPPPKKHMFLLVNLLGGKPHLPSIPKGMSIATSNKVNSSSASISLTATTLKCSWAFQLPQKLCVSRSFWKMWL